MDSGRHEGVLTSTSCQLKNRYQYLQSRESIPTEVPAVMLEMTPQQSTGEDGAPEVLSPPSLPIENESDPDPIHSVTDEADEVFRLCPSLPCVSSTSLHFRLPNDLPSLSLIDSAPVTWAAKGDRFSEGENRLFEYLMVTKSEQQRYQGGRSTIQWSMFEKRWNYWCRVETASGETGFQLRTGAQLKQKKKDRFQ